MTITVEHLKQLAKLSRIQLHEVELIKYQTDISNILGHIAKLQEVDTSSVAESHAAHLQHENQNHCPIRDDTVTEQDIHREIQKLAPRIQNDHYLVPIVIESE